MTDHAQPEDSTARRANLERAYMATAFVADVPGGSIEIRVGRQHPALDTLLIGRGADAWAFITAWNPASKQLPDAENATRQQRLRDELTSLRLVMFPGRGVPDEGDWPPEASLLVLDLAEADALRIGRDHGQNAVVVGALGGPARLVWCR
jgi:hypothetical protein